MAEIYLAPDSLLSEKRRKKMDPSVRRDRAVAAARVLSEIDQNRRRDPEHQILLAYCWMARGDQKNVDAAFDAISGILDRDPENASAILASATIFELQKVPGKTKSALQRLVRLPHRADEADAFEAAWLASAESSFAEGKFDQARELCRKCLEHNKSCVEAWELLGMICERETTAAEASECYEEAWRCGGANDPSVGFKLAFVLFKSRRMVECVDVCRAVLQKHPEYPKIKKDIMRKAQMSIRP
jgi:tetratricopeptide repeat protein 21B